MKIKLNTRYPEHDVLVERLSQELPELIIRSKEREWGADKPSFKHKKKLYEFDNIEEFMKQAKKILKMTDSDFSKKTIPLVDDIDPNEMGEIRKVEELILEIPVEKYNLQDLNIKLRLGAHQEKSSTYESDQQTLHYEVEEDVQVDEDSDSMVEETDEAEISMTSINNDIILDIPSEKYSLSDLNLSIKFTQYGEASSTYEVRKSDEKSEPSDPSKEPGPEKP
ncbi:hypothetical protein ACHAL6_08060 [Proteiniclasticum sp. C24MP]|uniref:hypothetical protein n=1 Tax=Proteiniclasticum sp. C24MP TaxID=3374101 RepID=UPI0037544023